MQPSARERFTPRELVDAYEDFVGDEPQYVDTETGIKAAAYRLGAGVLLVDEEPETQVQTNPLRSRRMPPASVCAEVILSNERSRAKRELAESWAE